MAGAGGIASTEKEKAIIKINGSRFFFLYSLFYYASETGSSWER